ncbi:hypothetical protein [Thiosulfatihalobacter marinus]|uniref:hypothetical protein n=1 Tax=Thiosulfatihalobacter marinus TaxID=2792481 RepID=UPI0018D9783B|nr:hypothetical protein [Thiosulfatihalobacter marinus]
MEAKDQADGEKRVKKLLIEPLENLGLGRPTTVNKAGYEAMVRTLCQLLAGKDADHLEALRDWAAANAGGPQRDRVPIAAKIIEQSRRIAPPRQTGDASPLLRAIFSAELGQRAIREGWAPELLYWLRSRPEGGRQWPSSYAISQIKKNAYDPMRRLDDIEMRLSEGREDEVSQEEHQFRQRRRVRIAECERIAEMGKGDVA